MGSTSEPPAPDTGAGDDGFSGVVEPPKPKRRITPPPVEPDWLDELFADPEVDAIVAREDGSVQRVFKGDEMPRYGGTISTAEVIAATDAEKPPAHPPASLWTGRESSDGKHRRKRAVRPQTLSVRQLARQRRHLPVVRYPADVERPKTRADCANVPRPCPFVSCKWHLYLDVQPNGSIRLNFPDLEPHQLPPDASCAVDVGEQGQATLERVAEILNLTRERVRQIEERLLPEVAARAPELRDLIVG